MKNSKKHQVRGLIIEYIIVILIVISGLIYMNTATNHSVYLWKHANQESK